MKINQVILSLVCGIIFSSFFVSLSHAAGDGECSAFNEEADIAICKKVTIDYFGVVPDIGLYSDKIVVGTSGVERNIPPEICNPAGNFFILETPEGSNSDRRDVMLLAFSSGYKVTILVKGDRDGQCYINKMFVFGSKY